MVRSVAVRRWATLLFAMALSAALVCGCRAIPFDGTHPALNYTYASGAPLRVAVLDETTGGDWSPAIAAATETYAAGTPYLVFQADTRDANIVIAVRRYDDAHPPELTGYVFPPGAGGFAAVYDAVGAACNFPPSTLPLNCTGEISTAKVYLNDIMAGGVDIESRRERLVLHELGHALGLTRHSPDLEIDVLAQRYGWSASGR